MTDSRGWTRRPTSSTTRSPTPWTVSVAAARSRTACSRLVPQTVQEFSGDYYCSFQAICYLTPGEEETEAGESRKNKEKQKRKEEKRKEKKKKKAKKNKNKNKEKEKEDENDYFDDYEEDYVDDEDDYEDEANTEEEESDGKIEEEDCDVFQCDIVRYGYQAFQLYGKVQTLRQQFDSLSEK